MNSMKNLKLLSNITGSFKQYCQEGDSVKALDNGIPYNAKVCKVHNVGGVIKYFIHYSGWARKYDTWVDEALIAKLDDTAKLAKILAETPAGTGPQGKKSKKASTKEDKPENSDSVADNASVNEESAAGEDPDTERSRTHNKGTKRKVEVEEQEALRKQRKRLSEMDLVDEDDDYYVSKLPIPPQLKKALTDEWKVITATDIPGNQGKLLQLPKPQDQTVEQIVKAFLEQRIPKLEKDKVQV